MTLIVMTMYQSTTSAALVPESIDWSRGPDIPLPRGGYYAAWYRGGLLVAGGTYWKDKKKIWTDRVSFYDPQRDHWEEWAPLPKPIAYGVMSEVGSKLYLIGGIDEKVLHHDIYRLEKQQWQRIGEAPAGVVYSTAVSIDSRIYVMGGGTNNNDLTTATNQAWCYEPKSGKWEKLPTVPGPPRVVHAAGAIGKQIYIFGGLTKKVGEPYYNLDDAYRFDTVKRQWTRINSLPQAARALWAVSVGGQVYLFGGMATEGLDTVYRYKPSTDEYQLVSRMPVALRDTKFFYHKGNFYGASGEDKAASRFSGLLIGLRKDGVTYVDNEERSR